MCNKDNLFFLLIPVKGTFFFKKKKKDHIPTTKDS